MHQSLRDQALLILEGRGAILDIAREVSRLMREAGVDGAVIGGVAVVLHGHVRTTIDVDVWTAGPLTRMAELLKANAFEFSTERREFMKAGVPLHLVTLEQIGRAPRQTVEVDGILTVDLASLIEMKLRSGAYDPLRAQDLADVIGLIRHNKLASGFAARLDSSVRPEFRKLVKAISKADKQGDRGGTS